MVANTATLVEVRIVSVAGKYVLEWRQHWVPECLIILVRVFVTSNSVMPKGISVHNPLWEGFFAIILRLMFLLNMVCRLYRNGFYKSCDTPQLGDLSFICVTAETSAQIGQVCNEIVACKNVTIPSFPVLGRDACVMYHKFYYIQCIFLIFFLHRMSFSRT